MELKFIGNGSGFSKTNNSAFFTLENNLYIIDMSMLNMNRIKLLFDFNSYKNIYIIITHMHADHVSGIPNIIDYLYYIFDIKVNLVVPTNLKKDIITLNEICGVSKEQYNIIDSKDLKVIKETIKTKHSNTLKNGCFGYLFDINNKNILYTGDTANLDAFEKYFNIVHELYVDINYNGQKVHVNFHEFIKNLPKCKKIYLMHLDEEDKIKNEIKNLDNVFIAEIYKGEE